MKNNRNRKGSANEKHQKRFHNRACKEASTVTFYHLYIMPIQEPQSYSILDVLHEQNYFNLLKCSDCDPFPGDYIWTIIIGWLMEIKFKTHCEIFQSLVLVISEILGLQIHVWWNKLLLLKIFAHKSFNICYCTSHLMPNTYTSH